MCGGGVMINTANVVCTEVSVYDLLHGWGYLYGTQELKGAARNRGFY